MASQLDSVLMSAIPEEEKNKMLAGLVAHGIQQNPDALASFVNSQQAAQMPIATSVDLGNIIVDPMLSRTVQQQPSMAPAQLQSAIAAQQSNPRAPSKVGSGLANFMQSVGYGAVGKPIDVGSEQAGWQSYLGGTLGKNLGEKVLFGKASGTPAKFFNTPEEMEDKKALSDKIRMLSVSAAQKKASELGVDPSKYTDKDGLISESKLHSSIADAVKSGSVKENRIQKQAAFSNVAKLRGEFDDLSKDFYMVRDSMHRIKASAQDPSAAGDIALIFNYMKMLDPRSVVRESEFATAQNAGNIPERVRSMYNAMLSKKGKRLSDNIRNDFVDRSEKLYSEQYKVHSDRIGRYSKLAEKYGYDPEDIVTDINFGMGSDEGQPMVTKSGNSFREVQ